MYFIGRNDYRQFGQDVEAKSLTQCQWNDKIPKSIALGFDHALYLYDAADDNNKQLFVAGMNEYGQCGIDNGFTKISTIRQLPFNTSITSIFTNHSSRHTFLQTSNNEIYAFGHNAYHQLGLNRNNNNAKISTATKVILPTTMMNIQTGYRHSTMISNSGQIFITTEEEYQAPWKKVSGLKTKIMQVAVGEKHKIFNDENGRLWCCGRNHCGQLGIGKSDDDEHLEAMMIPAFNQSAVIDIAAGSNHTLAALQNGDVFAFGWNNCSQCGKDKETGNIASPTKVDGLSSIQRVEAGFYHSAAIKTKGAIHIFMFGRNQFNECVAAPDKRIVSAPLSINEAVKKKTGESIKNIFLGYECSIILVEDDEKKEAINEDKKREKEIEEEARQKEAENEHLRKEREELRQKLEIKEAERKKVNETNKKMMKENERLNKEARAAKERQEENKQILNQMKTNHEEMRENLENATKMNEEQKRKISDLEKQLGSMQKRENEMREEIKKLRNDAQESIQREAEINEKYKASHEANMRACKKCAYYNQQHDALNVQLTKQVDEIMKLQDLWK